MRKQPNSGLYGSLRRSHVSTDRNHKDQSVIKVWTGQLFADTFPDVKVRIKGVLCEFESAEDFRVALGLAEDPAAPAVAVVGEASGDVWAGHVLEELMSRLTPAANLCLMALVMADGPLTAKELGESTGIHPNGVGASVAKIRREARVMRLPDPTSSTMVDGQNAFEIDSALRESASNEFMKKMEPKFEARKRAIERARKRRDL